MRDKRIVELNVGAMVAGSKYRGEFEERVKRSSRRCRAPGPLVLFIDELHTMWRGAGGGEGGLDIANMFKPALARGELRTLSAPQH